MMMFFLKNAALPSELFHSVLGLADAIESLQTRVFPTMIQESDIHHVFRGTLGLMVLGAVDM